MARTANVHEYGGAEHKATYVDGCLMCEINALREQLLAAQDEGLNLCCGTDHTVGLLNRIDRALSELGVPGPDYPAPVANAVRILRGETLEGHFDAR